MGSRLDGRRYSDKQNQNFTRKVSLRKYLFFQKINHRKAKKTIKDCFFSNDDFEKPSSSVVKLEVKIARNFCGVGIGFIFTGQILVFLNVINRNSIWNISALFNCIGMMFISLGTMKRFRKLFLNFEENLLNKEKYLNFLLGNLSRQSVLYQIKINF